MSQDARKCPECGSDDVSPPRDFNLLFRTAVGPADGGDFEAYLRPETAQGIFVAFQQVMSVSRGRFPMGIAQMGRAFRNEVSPRNFLFRQREFEQFELEYFCLPHDAPQQHARLLADTDAWLESIGLSGDTVRHVTAPADDLAHYALACTDIEYNFPSMGWGELLGVANRGDYDLRMHEQGSGEKMSIRPPPGPGETKPGEPVIPYVIEPSFGADRIFLALLCQLLQTEESGRAVFRLPSHLPPTQVAILPLLRRAHLTERASQLAATLRGSGRRRGGVRVDYDDRGSIGKRYRRHDEVGTPLCVTVDEEASGDAAQDTVTVRFRDSMEQVRVGEGDLVAWAATHPLG